MIIKVTEGGKKPRLGMMAWYASEGGRKCQWCGKYRKSEDLFDCVSGIYNGVAIDAAPMCKVCRDSRQPR